MSNFPMGTSFAGGFFSMSALLHRSLSRVAIEPVGSGRTDVPSRVDGTRRDQKLLPDGRVADLTGDLKPVMSAPVLLLGWQLPNELQRTLNPLVQLFIVHDALG